KPDTTYYGELVEVPRQALAAFVVQMVARGRRARRRRGRRRGTPSANGPSGAGDDGAGYFAFFRSFRMASSASIISSRDARALLKLSFRLNALVGGRKANT